MYMAFVDLGLHGVEVECEFKSAIDEVKSAGPTNLSISHILNDVRLGSFYFIFWWVDYLVVRSSISNIFFSCGFPWTNGPTEKIAFEAKNWLGLLDNDVLDGEASPMY